MIRLLFISAILYSFLFSIEYAGPEDRASDKINTRSGSMNGNRVLLKFSNTTQLSDWISQGLWDVSIWPNDGTGTRMLDGIALLIGGRVYIQNDNDATTLDTIIVDDYDLIDTSLSDEELSENFHIIHFLQTEYREEVDLNQNGDIQWTLYATDGYFEPTSLTPAMSNDSNSWPTEWPSTGLETKWPGEWDGRFGRGVQYADLETYFVANDAQDQEWIQEGNGFLYKPRPGKFIHDSASKQGGLPWGGLGIRVEARGFQWNNPLVRDALFWEYNISNISDYNLMEMSFGYWVDNGIGGETGTEDENGWFDKDLDLAFSWDDDDEGFGGTSGFGVMGFAFLESPSNSYDGIDNDGDGLIDEARDNGIDDDGDWVAPELLSDGSYNCEKLNDDVGLDGVGPADANWSGPDEGECNGVPDCQEGVGCEPNFDETDISESDMIGLTTFDLFEIDDQGKNSPEGKWFENDDVMWDLMTSDSLDQFTDEPENLVELFAASTFKLDKGRTERISMAELHSFDYIVVGDLDAVERPDLNLFKLKQSVQVIYESDYRFATPPNLPTLTAEAQDQRVVLTWDSIAEISRDPFLPKQEPLLDDNNLDGVYNCLDSTLASGSIVQYDCDGYTDLNGNNIWDENFQYDFEGYKLYKSTDKYFKDAQIITDGFGNPMFSDPIFQCDKDNGVKGFANWSPIFGTSYYLGDDTKLKHSYIDTDVDNGITYYYALVAYDYGMASTGDLATGLPPAENNAIVDINEQTGEIINYGLNVAIVKPVSNAAGWQDPTLSIDEAEIGTGEIMIDVMINENLIENAEYMLTFNTSLQSIGTIRSDIDTVKIYNIDTLSVSRSINNSEYEVVYMEHGTDFEFKNFIERSLDFGIIDSSQYFFNSNTDLYTDVFDGIRIILNSDSVKINNQKWTNIESNYTPQIDLSFNRYTQMVEPWDISINFLYDSDSYISSSIIFETLLDEENNLICETVNFNLSCTSSLPKVVNGYEPGYGNQSFVTSPLPMNFYVYNETLGDTLDYYIWDNNQNNIYDDLDDKIIVGFTSENSDGRLEWEATLFSINRFLPSSKPSAGDVFEVTVNRPFATTDTIRFSVSKNELVDTSQLNEDMENIKVVPNPYIATNLMEEAINNPNLNQRRKIMFTHLPSRCTIRIYTVSGALVDAIEVDNSSSDGNAYWDLLTNEGLEIAAGMYLFHVQSPLTTYEKIGKFAVIK